MLFVVELCNSRRFVLDCMPVLLVDNQRAKLLRDPLPNHFSLLVPVLVEKTLSSLDTLHLRLNSIQNLLHLLPRGRLSIIERLNIDQLLLDHRDTSQLQTNTEDDKEDPDSHEVNQLRPVDMSHNVKVAFVGGPQSKVHH